MITIVAGVLMGLTAQAQVQPNVLGENHAMVRLESGSKYVLLPVEEKAENASVRVIGRDNQCVRRPNVRLAVDHADYYVPLEIKDGQVLDIIFHGDRRTKGAPSRSSPAGRKSNSLTRLIRPTARSSARPITIHRYTAG